MPHYIQKFGGVSIIFVLLAAPKPQPALAGEPESSPPEMLADAELADVFFLDADQGWAVGDRGVILWTSDGGRRWELADSPVNCRIEAVFFLDSQRGWAVGGFFASVHTQEFGSRPADRQRGGGAGRGSPRPSHPS